MLCSGVFLGLTCQFTIMALSATTAKTSVISKIAGLLHLLGFFLVLLIILIRVIFVLLAVLRLVLGLLCIILLLLLGRLDLAERFPFGRKAVSLGLVVSDDDVVKDCATFDLPQVEANETKIFILVNVVIILVFGVCNLLGFPNSLVCRVRDPLAIPIALVLRVVLHGRFPVAVLLIVPVTH